LWKPQSYTNQTQTQYETNGNIHGNGSGSDAPPLTGLADEPRVQPDGGSH